MSIRLNQVKFYTNINQALSSKVSILLPTQPLKAKLIYQRLNSNLRVIGNINANINRRLYTNIAINAAVSTNKMCINTNIG